ncbi:OmpW family outer membrane protein [Aquabacterium sp.]|uniref:OmpW/AlkL family protein n=1 Tax=Aquabacterium sp. TaxID=1872578 RepID=UPI0025BF19FF|nr:OmpW family outer membrane protein [Aquabacterium sp.]
MSTSARSIFALAALLAAVSAQTASAQSYTVKLGGARIDPRATSSDLKGTLPVGGGSAVSFALPAGNQLEVQPKSTLILSIERAINDHFSAELVLGVPPKHDVKVRVGAPVKESASRVAQLTSVVANTGGTSSPYYSSLVGATVAQRVASYDGATVATVKQIAPTLFLNYKFLDAGSALRPYIGVGINYTHFSSTATTAGVDIYNDGPVRISLTDSIGFAAQVGASYQIDKNWSLNAGWSTAAVKNNITIRTNHGEQTATYRFHPSVFSATVGYTF